MKINITANVPLLPDNFISFTNSVSKLFSRSRCCFNIHLPIPPVYSLISIHLKYQSIFKNIDSVCCLFRCNLYEIVDSKTVAYAILIIWNLSVFLLDFEIARTIILNLQLHQVFAFLKSNIYISNQRVASLLIRKTRLKVKKISLLILRLFHNLISFVFDRKRLRCGLDIYKMIIQHFYLNLFWFMTKMYYLCVKNIFEMTTKYFFIQRILGILYNFQFA